MGDAVAGFLFADPAGGSLVTGEMYCVREDWTGNRTYNPAMPELELCPKCGQATLRPRRKLGQATNHNTVAVGGGESV